MKMKPIKLTPERIKELNRRNQEEAKRVFKNVDNMKSDTYKDKRLQSQTCCNCYYLKSGGLVGQAFTDYECSLCEEIFSHPNTGVPQVCERCSNDHGLCRKCGANY